MVIVSLTTDWGNKGLYSGLFKAKLVNKLPGAQIIDISHEILPYNINEGAFALRSSYRHFPVGSIHVVSLASMTVADKAKNREYICFEHEGHYFIGPNNGLWDMVFDDAEFAVYTIAAQHPDVQSFAEADACIDAVLQLSQGKALTTIGTPATRERGRGVGLPEIRGNQIVGSFLDFDSYGNGITNITKAHFEAVGKGRMFTIMVGGQILQTDTISTDYTNVPEKIIALFNSARFLEIAMPYFPLRNFLHDTNTAKVLITFYDSEAQKTNFKLI